MDSTNGSSDLQFESVSSLGLGPAEGTTPERVSCASCRSVLDSEYFDVNGHTVCEPCSQRLASHAESPRGVGALARAGAFGVVAAMLGSLVYFAVVAASGYQIGLIAIAIGYMVGYGIRMGTRGRGGRRFQILALVLTYWAIGLAYSSLTVKAIDKRAERQTAAAVGTATETATATPAARRNGDTAPPRRLTGLRFALGILELVAFTLVLPVLVVAGSLPGSLISAAIIAFGMQQAWRMTAAPVVTVSGPYRIGAQPSATAG
jgi:FtsH-binding integral membrane protein